MRFELCTLDSYDDTSLIEEIQRVANLVPGQRLTIAKFDDLSKVHSTTIRKRFGSWTNALEQAGLKSKVTDHAKKMEANKSLDKKKIALLLKNVASEQGNTSMTMSAFSKHTDIGQKTILARFGNWREALLMAGLEPVALGRRYTDIECYENLLILWMHYGRQPKYGELTQPPSLVGPKAYILRWGSWRKALRAFVEYAENDAEELDTQPQDDNTISVPTPNPEQQVRTRNIPLRVRYNILKRDHFKCVTCGRSPAVTMGIELHIGKRPANYIYPGHGVAAMMHPSSIDSPRVDHESEPKQKTSQPRALV